MLITVAYTHIRCLSIRNGNTKLDDHFTVEIKTIVLHDNKAMIASKVLTLVSLCLPYWVYLGLSSHAQ